MNGSIPRLHFACPACRTALIPSGLNEMRCPKDGCLYPCLQGIWRFLAPEAQQKYGRFVQEYGAVRQGEGRGSPDPAYYRSLPYRDLTGRFAADWEIRRHSYEALLRTVLHPLEEQQRRPLKLLDLGAGNGWLAYRMAQRGHAVAALDLLIDPRDGLGAHAYYEAAFTPVQADFDHLPFSEGEADIVIFNASLHYSTGYTDTLREALRVRAPGGRLVILDSPVYHDPLSGKAMVQEREMRFQQQYGFPSNALHSENYLTYERLERLSQELGLCWFLRRPSYGLDWALRPLKARLRGRREPAEFILIEGI